VRRLTATAALFAATFLATLVGAGPALADCPAPPEGQAPAPCDDTGPGRGSGDIPVPLPVIDPPPTPTTAAGDPASGPTATSRAGTRVSPAVRDAGTGNADVVGATPGLPFTGPRTATLVVVAGVLAAIGLGSLMGGRHRARH
jgi:hypothetical protein